MPTSGWSDAVDDAQQAREAMRARRAQLAEDRLAAQERALAEREAKRRKSERGKAMAVARTRASEEDIGRLEGLLSGGLRRDPYLDPESLKRPLRLPTFRAGRDAQPNPEPDQRRTCPSVQAPSR